MIDEKVLGRVANAGYTMMRNQVNATSYIESFRPNQIKCKKWLIEEILNFKMQWDRVLVLGSWNSILLYELFSEHGNVTWFDFVDIDPEVHRHREIYFRTNNIEMNYGSIIMDATEFSDHESYDLIINTSCEHMPDIPAVYGPLYALQSNDYRSIDDHINCVDSAKHLATKNNINKIFYEDEMNMRHYNRYMIIGYYS